MTRPRIIIETVTPAEQRAPTGGDGPAGDWYVASDGVLVIKITADVLSRQGFLFALHELVEAFLCLDRGIPQASIDAFHAKFSGPSEPGDHPDSPCFQEHRFSMLIEHLMAHELGVLGYGKVE